jgi:hypothetical protein
MAISIVIAVIVAYLLVAALGHNLEQKRRSAMFDECKTVEEVGKKGLIETAYLEKMLARLGRRGDVEMAKKLAMARLSTHSNKATLMRFID